jgi:hypothetical protein
MHPNPTKGTCGKDCVKEKIKIDDNMIANHRNKKQTPQRQS